MRKIKHIEDIQYEKMQLRIRQLELEKKIRNTWTELKEDLNPRIFIENKIAEGAHKKPEKGRLFADALIYGIDFFGRKISELAGKKMETAMHKGVEKLSQKLKTRFAGKS